jgi:hypothetical protein
MIGTRETVLTACLLVTLGLLQSPSVRAQSSAAAPAVGRVVRVDPYAGGLAPAAPGYVAPTQAAATANANANAAAMDPLGLNFMYGPGIPMTRAQTALYMLSVQQRTLGLGNGQLSGVRPGQSAESDRTGSRVGSTSLHPTETHTRDMNIPGGQAARYFNRAGSAATRSRPYYNRQTHQFPQTSR